MKGKKIIILDGAMGTYLEEKGYKGFTPELACLEKPELVEEIHKEYVKNGAEIILTNTFGANKKRLKRKNIEGKFEEINKKAIEIASRIKNEMNIKIAGDIGPTGELLYPYGDLTEEECKEIFLSHAEFFYGKVDLVVLETFTDLSELKIAYSTLRNSFSVLIVPCLSFQMGKEFRTMMGNSIHDYINWCVNEEVKVIGVNCGVGSNQIKEIVKEIGNLTEKPLWIKPNAGIPEIRSGKVIFPESPEEFAENCLYLCRNYNVKFIGGCCGTNPSYIRRLKEKIHENN